MNNQGPQHHEHLLLQNCEKTLAKLFQAMTSRTICWQNYRTTYLS